MNPLHRAFGFDNSDLDANRQGQLSPYQQRKLQQAATPPLPIDGIRNISIGLLVLGFITAFLNFNVTVSIMFGGIGLSGIFFWAVEAWRTNFYQTSQVEVVQGVAYIGERQTTNHEFRGESITLLEIGDQTFPIDGIQANLIETGAVYTIYHIGDVLLSLEPAFEDNSLSDLLSATLTQKQNRQDTH